MDAVRLTSSGANLDIMRETRLQQSVLLLFFGFSRHFRVDGIFLLSSRHTRLLQSHCPVPASGYSPESPAARIGQRHLSYGQSCLAEAAEL